MNKRTLLLSFLIFLSLVLTACQQEPERTKSKNQGDIPSSAEGITIQLEKKQYMTKKEEATLTIQNDNETRFLYGKEYLLEKNVNGTWYKIPLQEGMGFTAEGYNLIPGQTVSETIALDIFNEELSAGNYRMIKVFIDNKKNTVPKIKS